MANVYAKYRVPEMAAQLLLCRICLSEVQPKHATALYTDVGPSRLRELLLVPVDRGDDLPTHICRSCVGKVETLERKLKTLRQQARESIKQLHARPSRKRSKNTSGSVEVSPATVQARPSNKRAVFQGSFSLHWKMKSILVSIDVCQDITHKLCFESLSSRQ